MICRALSKNNHIIWFRKDMETPTHTYYKIGETNTGYVEGLPKGYRITIEGVDYRVSMINSINGRLFLNGVEVGVCTLTTPPVEVNYSKESAAVADSLIQRLSVIKGELWYQVNYGLPLTEKQRGTNVLDLVIADIITSHPGVASLDSYTSKVTGHEYSYTCSITSVYGDNLTISNNLTI